MPQCPRCGDLVEQLEPLPSESLLNGVGQHAGSDGQPSSGRACHWCRHEILEK